MEFSGWSANPKVHLFYKTEEVFRKKKNNNEDDDDIKADLLNSFFIEDLEKIMQDYEKTKKLPLPFETYIRANINEEFTKLDLKEHTEVLKGILRPSLYPDGRWPSEYKASLMQQFAVNHTCSKLMDNPGGIFSVNGPPGTGKTTLLRDIIAAIFVERAKKLVLCDNPSDLFTKVESVEVNDNYKPTVYAPDPSLCDSGIVIASSNNGAVENISKELPLKKEVKPYHEDIQYFREVSESCISNDNWGLISAVLGNKENRKKLVDAIWFTGSKEQAKFTLKEALKRESYTLQTWKSIVEEHKELNGRTWIGSPLRVHRRCIEPMFSISNKIAYNGLMFNSTLLPEKVQTQFETRFIPCSGEIETGCRHYVRNQFIKIQEILLNEINMSRGLPDIFVISPFSEVAYKLRVELFKPIKQTLRRTGNGISDENLSEWLMGHIGTVHTFQGKQAEGVILCLGLDSKSIGAVNWAASKPNLLNVAITRAKYRFIAIGDENLWLFQDFFEELSTLNKQ